MSWNYRKVKFIGSFSNAQVDLIADLIHEADADAIEGSMYHPWEVTHREVDGKSYYGMMRVMWSHPHWADTWDGLITWYRQAYVDRKRAANKLIDKLKGL